VKKVYIISDTHFLHKEIIGISGRPFSSVKEMDKTILDNINETVMEEDTLIHLGDVGFGSWKNIQDIILQIKCNNKILVMGNHDRNLSPQTWREIGFQEVSPWPIIYDDWYIMCHEPILIETNSPFGVIYGHTHHNNYDSPNHHYFNTSIEAINYKPMLLDDIKDTISSGKGQFSLQQPV
jgi:calcineurin-like phosphoesterase family protein